MKNYPLTKSMSRGIIVSYKGELSLPRLRSSVELGTHNLIRIMPAEGNSDTISRSSDGKTLFYFVLRGE